MKKTHLIIAGLLVVALVSCNNLGKTGSSLVTITVGSDKTASLSIQRATLYARLKNFLAAHLQMPAAMASIPSNVASIQITVWASDMPLITQTIDTTGLASVNATFVVPNGSNRLFAITGFDSSGTKITYGGGMSADLNGAKVSLPVPMINLGTVPQIFYVSTTGNDITGDGSLQKPYRTISNTFRVATNGTVGILVWPGTYDTTGGEMFPLTLPPATTLACLGTSDTVVIDDSGAISTGAPLITGTIGGPGSRIDSCKIKVTVFPTAIDDGGGALTVNNSFIQGAGLNILTPTSTGISLSGASTVSKSTINSIYDDGSGTGIRITGANATVTQCIINANAYGLVISGGTSTISGNTISNNSGDGMRLFASAAPPTAVISGNTIGHNGGYGIYAPSAGGSSIHSNSMFCNSVADFYLADSTANNFDVSGNAWDHDNTTTLISGPTITSDAGGCSPGVDICYNSLITGGTPTFLPVNSAVPGGCQ